ncbi:MAG: hypothetical protein JXR86_03490 [Spirochaetales bacterium]|nr:hypothetical protein [Spirochaetales bacterium]
MESMTELLEQELEEAVEVKNRKSFHRFILLLAQNVVSRNTHEREIYSLRSDIKDVIALMERRFEAVDRRFESVDQRFESMQKQMDVRFNAMDKRFSMMFAFMSLGFTALAVLFTVFNYI